MSSICLASTVDIFWVWEQISKLNNLLKEIVGRSFCNTQWDITSIIVEHSCSLSEAICNFLRIVIIIIILSQKISKWNYRPCLNISTFHDKAEQLIWTMFFFDYQLKLSIIHQSKTRSICKWKHTKITP